VSGTPELSELPTPAGIPRWFWVVAGIAAGAVVIGLALWYAQHPDRSPFVDFPAAGPAPATNGLGPSSAPPAAADVVAAAEGDAGQLPES
jgi:hypothetical protein